MNRKIIIVLLSMCLSAEVLMAQETPATPGGVPAPAIPNPQPQSLLNRLFFGGNLGLAFGSITFVNVSPIIGYRITETFGAGLGPSYSYYRDNRDRNFVFETNTYGGRVFAQQRITDQLLAYAEYELLNMEVPDLLFRKLVRTNISSLFVGGGYGTPLGNARSSAFVLVLFNVLESEYQVYQNPVIRGGFNFGF